MKLRNLAFTVALATSFYDERFARYLALKITVTVHTKMNHMQFCVIPILLCEISHDFVTALW